MAENLLAIIGICGQAMKFFDGGGILRRRQRRYVFVNVLLVAFLLVELNLLLEGQPAVGQDRLSPGLVLVAIQAIVESSIEPFLYGLVFRCLRITDPLLQLGWIYGFAFFFELLNAFVIFA